MSTPYSNWYYIVPGDGCGELFVVLDIDTVNGVDMVVAVSDERAWYGTETQFFKSFKKSDIQDSKKKKKRF